MQGMRLEHLSVMHEPSHFLTGRCQSVAGTSANNYIKRFCCGQMMAHRANTTKTLNQHRGFPIRPSLNKTLKPPELYNMQPTLYNIIIVIQMDGDLTMSFNSGNRFYRYLLCHFSSVLIEFNNFIRQLQFISGNQGHQCIPDQVSPWGATGKVIIYLDHFMTRIHLIEYHRQFIIIG